jgi:catechol 2,3-dioxygenase-like lactoylglutathione lyase family enzyme
MRLHHLAIQVPDLAAAAAFYGDLLGLAVLRRQPHAVWVDAGGTILMLERCADAGAADDDAPWASPAPGPFVVAFGIAAGERATWRERLAAAGVAIHHESSFTLYFRDPWGTRLALSHHPEPAPG